MIIPIVDKIVLIILTVIYINIDGSEKLRLIKKEMYMKS